MAYIVCGLLGYSVGGTELAILILGSLGPDILTNTPMYIKLRRKYGYWPMKTEDWSGYQTKMPGLYKFYMICHNFTACGAVLAVEHAIIWLTGWYTIPVFSVGYLLHVLYDIPSHSGEFNIEPLWPISKWNWGITDSWAWPIKKMAAAWAIHLVLIGALLALR